MGNFSRDSFKETNVVGNLMKVNAPPATDARHYVGVRMQQGVPILDADWNELEDIRRYDLQACLKHYFGSGIPDGDKGFQIIAVTDDNNFKIETGLALVEGMLVVNQNANLTYATQNALFTLSLPALAPPVSGVRDDLVYLDVWEEERDQSDGPAYDERLINPLIGIETCTRIERRWAVRVSPATTTIDAVPHETGHEYMALARVRRVENQPRIDLQRITDLRRTGINVAKYLQVPVFIERGADMVDSQRMVQLFEALRSTLMLRVANNQLFVGSVAEADRNIVYFAVQYVMQVCVSGSTQAGGGSMNNAGALKTLATLRDAQNDFLDALTTHGAPGSATATFVTQYRGLLTGGPGVPGVSPALAAQDLIGAYKGQQAVNAFLAAAVDALPEGTTSLQFLSVSPFTPLVAGQPYVFTVEFTSNVTSQDQTSELFDIAASLSSGLWNVTPNNATITLNNSGGKGTRNFTVVPGAGNVKSDLSIVATAHRNPSIKTLQLPLALELNKLPAVAAKLMYAGPPFNSEGRADVPDADLRSGGGFDIQFGINNRTDQQHTYRVESQVSLQVGSETGWTPTASNKATADLVVAAHTTGTSPVTLIKTGASAVGNRGTLQFKLLKIDGSDLPVDQQETVSIAFTVV